MSLLLTVAYIWRQEQIADNARQISDLGKKLYDAIAVYSGHMEGIRKGLENAVKSYNAAVGSLERTVLVPAREFKKLGATAGKDLLLIEPLEPPVRQLAAPEAKAATAEAQG